MSLNFRPYHNNSSSKMANFRFYSHLILVLLGARPSICSHMRSILYPTDKGLEIPVPALQDVVRTTPEIPTTAAYLIFCDGSKAVIMEKDHRSSITRQYCRFGVITNHDTPSSTSPDEAAEGVPKPKGIAALGMQDLLDESADRRDCIQRKWDRAARRHRDATDPTMTLEQAASSTTVSQRLLTDWVKAYPTTNEETHFAALMDPRAGEFVWVKRLQCTEIYSDGPAPLQLTTQLDLSTQLES